MTPVEIARSYLGTRWVHQGRSAKGLDCVGLLILAFKPLGAWDRTDYGRDPHNDLLERYVAEQMGPPIPKSQMRPGDVVCMAFPTVVRHVGLITDHSSGLGLIHTYASLKKVTEHRLCDRWFKRIRYVHRWGNA